MLASVMGTESQASGNHRKRKSLLSGARRASHSQDLPFLTSEGRLGFAPRTASFLSSASRTYSDFVGLLW